MDSFVRFLIDPFNLLWILAALTIAAGIGKRKQWFRQLAIISVLWFILISTPWLPGVVINSLEDRFIPVDIENLQDISGEFHIIVLGGGHGFDDRLPANSLLSEQAVVRLTEGIRLHRQLPESKLILSGYSASGRTTQAEMLHRTAKLLGVDDKSMMTQEEPSNTYEEAMFYSELYGGQNPVILVTGATHMARAVYAFNHAGIEVIPSPTHFKLKGSQNKRLFGIPSVRNIMLLRDGVSEYTGLMWYKFKASRE